MIARLLRTLALKRAIPFDTIAYEAELEARLADRKAKRPANSKRAVQGHKTRRMA
jgi:hypothetical protein